MKLEIQQKLAELSTLTQGLLYQTVIDAEFEVFIWEVAQKGIFTVERLLLDLNYLQPISLEQFFELIAEKQSQATQQQYAQLVTWWQSHLVDCQVYRFTPRTYIGLPAPVEFIPIFVGATTQAEWIGITSSVELYFRMGNTLEPKPPTPTTELTTQIHQMTQNLTHSVDLTCYTLRQPPLWQIVQTASQATLIKALLEAGGFLATVGIGEGIDCSPPAENESEPRSVNRQRTQTLINFLESAVHDIRVYLIGASGYVDHYAIGQTQSGDWFGVSTMSYSG